MNIADNLEKSACYFPNHEAVIDGDRTITYSEFNQEASRIASGLRSSGVLPGDHVAICAPNSYAWLAFYFGVLKAGAVVITFSNHVKSMEFNRIIADCQPRVIFTTDERVEDIGERESRPYLNLVVCERGDISYNGLVEKGDFEFQAVERNRKDTAAIIYTGGITGIAKGAMLSHENIQASLFNVAYYERSDKDDVTLCFMPLHHVFGQVHIMNATIFAGGRLVIQSGFDLEKALKAINRYQVTKIFGGPTTYFRLLSVEDIRSRLKSVRYCLSPASNMALDIVREWKTRTGMDIQESYGTTECSSIVAFNHFCRPVPRSVGTPVNLVEVQIRDYNGDRLKTGKAGEICIRGPNIFKGYLNNPEETNAAFWGDWFRSGDVGVLNEDGYIFLMDRLKDMIISDGEHVYPREVEEILYTRPEVQECAVIGLPDKEFGEKITAFIVPQRGRQIDPAVLQEFLNKRLPGFKVPKEFVTVSDLPKTASGKLLKRELKRKFSEETPPASS
jgi:long-chain acyl-CoA synthetase